MAYDKKYDKLKLTNLKMSVACKMLRKHRLILTLNFISFSITLLTTGALPQWTEYLDLSLGAQVSTQPAICSKQNELYAVWSDSRLGGRELFFRMSRDGGLTWSDEERLTESEGDSVRPAIVCDRKYLHLVWEEQGAGSSDILYKRWDGTGWGQAQILSAGLPAGEFLDSRKPDVATTTIFPGSIVFVVWESASEKNTSVYLTRSVDDGLTWSIPRTVVNGDWDTSEPEVAGGVRTAHVVWRDEREGEGKVFIRQWGEVALGDEVRLSAYGDCKRPVIAALESLVYVGWESSFGEGMPSNIFVTQSDDGGGNFLQAQHITQNTAESILLTLVVSAGDVWVVWQDGQAGNWEIFYSIKNFRNSHWQSVERFTSTDIDSIMPCVASTPGAPDDQIHLLWVERQNEERSNLIYVRRDTIPPLPPSKPTHFDMNAPLPYDNDNTLTFLWEENVDQIEPPDKYKIYVSIDDEEFQHGGESDKPIFELNNAESGGTYRLAVEAVDKVGNVSERSDISESVIVDATMPEVFIHLPLPNTTLAGDTPVIITCRYVALSFGNPDFPTQRFDVALPFGNLDFPTQKFDALVQWRLMYGETVAPKKWQLLLELSDVNSHEVENYLALIWDVSELEGVYSLALFAVDEAGNESLLSIPLVIDNRPPLPISTGESRELFKSDLEADYRMPVWSPDGSKIAYVSNEGGAEDIWVFDLGSQTKTRLTRDIEIGVYPAWSADSEWIVYQSLRDTNVGADGLSIEGNWDIWAIRTDGSNQRPLISDAPMERHPAVSASGRQLAFTSDKDGDGEIWLLSNFDEVINTNAPPHATQLTRNDWEEASPSWSPDETKITFQSDRRGNWDIFQINVDGSNDVPLTTYMANETNPKWAPDGKRILFVSDQSGIRREILALGPYGDGSDIVQLSPYGEDARYADWSNDGNAMVYQSGMRIYSLDFLFPPAEIEALILHPHRGEHINGKVNIIGIARGTDFQSYHLELFVGSTPEQTGTEPTAFPIGGISTAQVSQVGFLGQFDASALLGTIAFQGEYLIKLVVTGRGGESVEDTVRVIIEDERPKLLVTSPEDNLITEELTIRVTGQTEPQTQVRINGERVKLDEEDCFSAYLLLNEGQNEIAVKAENSMGAESVVHRVVYLDTQEPHISIETPKSDNPNQDEPLNDFKIVEVPYLPVAVSVDKKARVEILGVSVSLEPGQKFRRTILLSEDANLISVEAVDQLGRTKRIQRRVIYEKPDIVRKDVSPPGITNVMPPDGATLGFKPQEISAVLVDDVAIDPETIVFTFDDVEYDDWEFDEESSRFSFTPQESLLIDGEHKFTIDVKDTSEITASQCVSFFFIDAEPLEAAISAESVASSIKVICTSSKLLANIPASTITPGGSSIGYSLNLNYETTSPEPPYRYADIFDASASQRSFSLHVSIIDRAGRTSEVFGYFAQARLSATEETILRIADGPDVVFPVMGEYTGSPLPNVILRSQEVDVTRTAAQRQNADSRNLKLMGIVYVVETDREELKEENEQIGSPLQFTLKLHSSDSSAHFAMFYWDIQQPQHWIPLDATIDAKTGQIVADVEKMGSYALLIDEEAPEIKNLRPKDGESVPLDRFLVEAVIADTGSGIAWIELSIDARPAEYEINGNRLVYLPANLPRGLHTLKLSVWDRASNFTEISSTFFTSDVFEFAGDITSYPNPAKEKATFIFKLTKSADVTLEIYDVSAQLVYTDKLRDVTGERFSWDCKNRAGTPVASGVYIYVIEATRDEQTIRKTGKIAVVK